MDRSYLADHKVLVYLSRAEREAGAAAIKSVTSKPYPKGGFDNYSVDGVMYPGFRHGSGELEACVYLDQPLFRDNKYLKG